MRLARIIPALGALLPLLANSAAGEESADDRRVRLLAARAVLTAQMVSRMESRADGIDLARPVLDEIGTMRERPESPAAARAFLSSVLKLLALFQGDQLKAERQGALRVCTEIVDGAGPAEKLRWRVRSIRIEVDLAGDTYDRTSARHWAGLIEAIADPEAGSAEHRADLQKTAADILKREWWSKPLAADLDDAPSPETLQTYRGDVGVRAELLAGLARMLLTDETEFKLFLSKLLAAPTAAGDRPASRALALWETYELLAALARATGEAWSGLGSEIRQKLVDQARLIPLELTPAGPPAPWPLGLPEDAAVRFDAKAPPGIEVVAWAAPGAPFVLASLDRLSWDRYHVRADTVWAVRLTGTEEPLAVARWKVGTSRAELPLPERLPKGYVLFRGTPGMPGDRLRLCSRAGWSRTRLVKVLEGVRPTGSHDAAIRELQCSLMNKRRWAQSDVDTFEDPGTRMAPDGLEGIADGTLVPALQLPDAAFVEGLPGWVRDLLGWHGEAEILTGEMRAEGAAAVYSLHDVIDVRPR